jgi:plasmid stability protein
MTEAMATLTIRNIPARVIRGLKSLARRRNTSMEQEVRQLLEEYVAERVSVQKQIEASWSRQDRRPSAAEIDSWINSGRD